MLFWSPIGGLIGGFWIFFFSKRLLLVMISVCFKFLFCKTKIYFFILLRFNEAHLSMFPVLQFSLRGRFATKITKKLHVNLYFLSYINIMFWMCFSMLYVTFIVLRLKILCNLWNLLNLWKFVLHWLKHSDLRQDWTRWSSIFYFSL